MVDNDTLTPFTDWAHNIMGGAFTVELPKDMAQRFQTVKGHYKALKHVTGFQGFSPKAGTSAAAAATAAHPTPHAAHTPAVTAAHPTPHAAHTPATASTAAHTATPPTKPEEGGSSIWKWLFISLAIVCVLCCISTAGYFIFTKLVAYTESFTNENKKDKKRRVTVNRYN